MLLVSGALALTLAACGSSTARNPAGNLAFTVPATSAPPGVTAVQPPQPAANDAALPRCTPAELTLTLSRVTDTIGQVNFTLHVTNSGQIDCFLEGYATAVVQDGGTQTRTETASDVLQVPPPAAVVLRPALSATADLHLNDGDNGDDGGERCARHTVRAVDVGIATGHLGQVPVHGSYWVCAPAVSGQLGMAAWAPVIHSDLDENDA